MKNVIRGFVMVIAAFVMLTGGVLVQGFNAQAKTKVSNGNIYLYNNKYKSEGITDYVSKATMKGNKLTLKGTFRVKINGQKKRVKKITLKLSPKCKHYLIQSVDVKISKKEMRGYVNKLNFGRMVLRIKNGKVTRIELNY